MKSLPAFVALAALTLLPSCASIVKGGSRLVTVESVPSGARLWVDGEFAGTTPKVVRIGGHADGELRLQHPGYRTTRSKIERHVEPWLLGNILFGGLIGLVIDAASGAGTDRPEEVTVRLERGTR